MGLWMLRVSAEFLQRSCQQLLTKEITCTCWVYVWSLHCTLSLIRNFAVYSILNLQVARAALKTLGTLRSNPTASLSASSSYFSSLFSAPSLPITIASSSVWLSHSVQLQILSLRACYQVSRLERLLASGKSFGDLSWECVSVSRAIVEAFIVRRILEAIDNETEGLLSVGIGEGERSVVRDVMNFVSLTSDLQKVPRIIKLLLTSFFQYILHTIEQALPDLLEFGIIGASSPSASSLAILSSPIESLRAQIDMLAQRILPQSVSLVDSFGFSDYDLDSAVSLHEEP